MRPGLRSSILIIAIALTSSATAQSADYVGMSGKELYARFCAACHGTNGRGDGPVASSLKVEVPDLTLMARRAGGTFPRDRVERIIDGRSILGAHGSRTMPIWGEDLSRRAMGDPDAERGTLTILERLTDYVWQLQRAPSDATR